MPAPYTIEQTAQASGLPVKYVRRLRSAMPTLFEGHTERGKSNALLFGEEMVEILKRTKELRSRGRTLQQIRDEMMEMAGRSTANPLTQRRKQPLVAGNAEPESQEDNKTTEAGDVLPTTDGGAAQTVEEHENSIPLTAVLRRENTMLQSQVALLTGLLERAEARFDRLLPEARETKDKRERKEGLKSQLLMWLVEAVVVTVFAAGFIFLIWLFAQKAFGL